MNILIGIKRFFKNRNTVTIFAVIICVAILYYFYNDRINKATNPVNMPYATIEIGPRTMITSNMVGTRKVNGGVVGNGNVEKITANIVGKYVKSNTVIPKGSLFYSDYLTDDYSESKKSLYDDIPDGFTLVSLAVSMESTFGNSIYPGNYIDLYFSTTDKNGKLMIGKLIESIQVLGVIDASGNNVFEKTSTESLVPAYLIFSVREDYYLLLQKTNYLYSAALFPVQRNQNYSEEPKPTSIASSKIQSYIEENTKNVASIDAELKVQGITVDQFLGGSK